MFGPVIDTVIAMATIYLVLSLLCTAVQEWLAQWTALRATNLKKGLDALLGQQMTTSILDHGIMAGLAPKGGSPSYIPPDRFVAAISDLYMSGKQSAADVKSGLRAIPDEKFRQAALAMYDDAEDKVETFKRSLETWFDQSMETVSGVYKRKVQYFILAIAIVVTVGMNFDSLEVAKSVWTDSALRTAIAEIGQKQAAGESAPQYDPQVLEKVTANLPIGWSAERRAEITQNWATMVTTVFGWLISIVALSFGAPFWFDILKSAVNIRGDGPNKARTATRQA